MRNRKRSRNSWNRNHRRIIMPKMLLNKLWKLPRRTRLFRRRFNMLQRKRKRNSRNNSKRNRKRPGKLMRNPRKKPRMENRYLKSKSSLPSCQVRTQRLSNS